MDANLEIPKEKKCESSHRMKTVKWTDKDGYHHISLLRDGDPDSLAPQGISCDPPNIEDLDWNAIKREIHNLLVDRGITRMNDLNRDGLNNSIIVPIRRRMIELYRSNEIKEYENE